MEFVKHLKFNSDGLIPAIVQDATNGRVLMMAWMNESALRKPCRRVKLTFGVVLVKSFG
jgi:phosphoribosyl-AMP cyclohydrolase